MYNRLGRLHCDRLGRCRPCRRQCSGRVPRGRSAVEPPLWLRRWRMPASLVTMASISAMVASIFSRSAAFSTFSVRNRSSVKGVRKSCEIAASMRVRFSIRATQTRLHGVESVGGLSRLNRAGLGHRRSIQVVAKPLGCGRERGKWRRHTPHDPHGHGENDDRHDPHGQEELA